MLLVCFCIFLHFHVTLLLRQTLLPYHTTRLDNVRSMTVSEAAAKFTETNLQVTVSRYQTPTIDNFHPIHRHKVDLVTHPDTDPKAAVSHHQLVE